MHPCSGAREARADPQAPLSPRKRGSRYRTAHLIAKPFTLEQLVLEMREVCWDTRKVLNALLSLIGHSVCKLVRAQLGASLPLVAATQDIGPG